MCGSFDPWSQNIQISAIESAYPEIGSLSAINILSRNGLGSDGGRVTSIQLVGSSSNVTIPGAEFAARIGLYSDWFSASGPISINNDAPAPPPASPAPNSGVILASNDGGTAAEDGASDLGSTYTYGITGLSGSKPLNAPVVGVAATPSGNGYWLVAADGGVFNFGAAAFYGSTYTYGITGLSGSKPLNAPIVGMAPTASGNGYWLVAADGGVFDFGAAAFYGSAYSKGYTGLSGPNPLPSKVVAIAPTPSGNGYWILEANGDVLPFGGAKDYGSLPPGAPGSGFVGIASTADGNGYWLVTRSGSVYGFGDAPSYGSFNLSGQSATVVGITSRGSGYSLILSNGQVVGFDGGPSSPALSSSTTGHGAPVIGGAIVG